MQRQGWEERGRCSLGGAVRLRLPPGGGGVADWVGAIVVWRQGGRWGGVPWGQGRGITARESGRGSDECAMALLGRWYRNGIDGVGRGQRECCGVGGVLVAGWDDDGGRCAVVLLGRWRHCRGIWVVAGVDQWPLCCCGRRGLKGMLQSTCCWVGCVAKLGMGGGTASAMVDVVGQRQGRGFGDS